MAHESRIEFCMSESAELIIRNPCLALSSSSASMHRPYAAGKSGGLGSGALEVGLQCRLNPVDIHGDAALFLDPPVAEDLLA